MCVFLTTGRPIAVCTGSTRTPGVIIVTPRVRTVGNFKSTPRTEQLPARTKSTPPPEQFRWGVGGGGFMRFQSELVRFYAFPIRSCAFLCVFHKILWAQGPYGPGPIWARAHGAGPRPGPLGFVRRTHLGGVPRILGGAFHHMLMKSKLFVACPSCRRRFFPHKNKFLDFWRCP